MNAKHNELRPVGRTSLLLLIFMFTVGILLTAPVVYAADTAPDTPGSEWVDSFNNCIKAGKTHCKKKYPPKTFNCDMPCFKQCKTITTSEPAGYNCYMSGNGSKISEDPCILQCDCIYNCTDFPPYMIPTDNNGSLNFGSCDPVMNP